MIGRRSDREANVSSVLRRRRRLTLVVILAAFAGAGLGAGYAAAIKAKPTAVSYDYVSLAAVAAKADDPFAGSEFVLQRMSGYAKIASSDEVLGAVRSQLDLRDSVSALRNEVRSTTPPDTAYLQIQVANADAAAAVRIANAIAAQTATVIESLEAQGGNQATSPLHVTAVSSGAATRTGNAVHYAKSTLLGLGAGIVLGILIALLMNSLGKATPRLRDPETSERLEVSPKRAASRIEIEVQAPAADPAPEPIAAPAMAATVTPARRRAPAKADPAKATKSEVVRPARGPASDSELPTGPSRARIRTRKPVAAAPGSPGGRD